MLTDFEIGIRFYRIILNLISDEKLVARTQWSKAFEL